MDKTMLKFRIEGYKRKAKKKIEDTKNAVGIFCMEHPAEAAAIAVGVLSAAERYIRYADKQKTVKADEFKQKRTIYDHSTNHRWVAKRDISDYERYQIYYRHSEFGEDYYTILTSMGLM